MKKLLTYAVVISTIVWSMGLGALIPAASAAYSPVANDVVKVTGANRPAVYIVGSDLKPYVFSTRNTFGSWFDNFNALKYITQTEFDAMTLGGNVTLKPGTLMKFDNGDNVYAVVPGNKLCKLSSDAAAKALYGINYAARVQLIQVAFVGNYTVDAACALDASSKLPNGTLIQYAGSSDIYYIDNGVKRLVTNEAFLANGFKTANVVTNVPTTMTFDAGSSITGKEAGLTTVTLTGAPIVPVSVGNLSVSLAADTPAATTLASGTAYNKMVKVNLTAGSADVNVKGITITRTGIIANTSVSAVSVWDQDGNRKGDVMSSINSNNQVTIGFASAPLVVPAGQTKSLTVAFNISGTTGTVGADVAAIDSNGTVVGSFPIKGNIMGLVDGSSSLSSVKVEGQAVGGNTLETDSANVEIGETKEIAKLKLTETTGRNDVQLEKVTLYFQGTAKDSDVTDISLVAQDNTVLATVAKATDKFATLSLATPFLLGKGLNRTLTVKAKVANGSGNTFKVQVQSEYDIMVKDLGVGTYLVPSDGAGTWDAVSSANGWFKMKSGTLSITKNSTSPSGNVSAGTNDQVLARYDVKAVGEDVEIRKIGIKIASTTGGLDLSGNVTVKMDGQTLLTFSGDFSADLYTNGSQRSLSQYFTVKSGETKSLEIIGNIDGQATNETYQVYVGNFYGKRLSTLDFADNMPSASYATAGNQLTIETTDISASKDTSFPGGTISKGSEQVVGQFIFKAGNAEDICITNATIKLEGGFDSSNDFNWMELWSGSTQLGSRVNTVSTSSNTFSFNLCLVKNEAKSVTVKAYVLSSAGSGTGNVELNTFSYYGKTTNNTDSPSPAVNGQTIALGNANLVITSVNDSGTISAIRLGSQLKKQLGKWKLEAENDDITLNKLSLTTRKELGAALTDSGNFGTLYLYDSANMTTPLGTATYIAGEVQFSGLNLKVTNGNTKNLVLLGDINSTVDVASKVAFVVTSDSSSKMEAKDSSGATLDVNQIDSVKGVNQTDSLFATSSFYLFHNAAPEIAENTFGTAIDIGSSAKVFRFVVTNNGNRAMRIGSTTISANVSGLTDGVMANYALYEANASGQPGTKIAQVIGTSSNGATDVTFGTANDVNSLMDNLSIDAGSSRTFVLTADTTGMIGTKSTGVITVNASLDGITGYSTTAGSDGDQYWGDGPMQYYYTPAGGAENTTPYTASDSYDVNGTAVKYSL